MSAVVNQRCEATDKTERSRWLNGRLTNERRNQWNDAEMIELNEWKSLCSVQSGCGSAISRALDVPTHWSPDLLLSDALIYRSTDLPSHCPDLPSYWSSDLSYRLTDPEIYWFAAPMPYSSSDPRIFQSTVQIWSDMCKCIHCLVSWCYCPVFIQWSTGLVTAPLYHVLLYRSKESPYLLSSDPLICVIFRWDGTGSILVVYWSSGFLIYWSTVLLIYELLVP